MRLKWDEDDDVSIQMAPLIDCVFLLLIFFLVATTLKDMHREIPVTLPHADAAVETETRPETLVLGVDKFGRRYANGQPATITVLFEQIRLAKQEGRFVRIKADEDARWKRVLEILEICHVEGVKNVKVQTADAKLGK